MRQESHCWVTGRRTDRVRTAVMILLLAVSASACQNASPEASAKATIPDLPTADRCPASGATVSIGQQDAAMGLKVVALRLTNCGDVPLSVKGYPKISLLDKDQRPLKVATHLGAPAGIQDPGPSALTLQPQKSLEALLSWRSTVTGGKKAVTAAFLAAAPSSKDAPQTVPLVVDVGTTATVNVTAWYSGSQLK